MVITMFILTLRLLKKEVDKVLEQKGKKNQNFIKDKKEIMSSSILN